MRGWHKESYRHYLASKGVKTAKYRVPPAWKHVTYPEGKPYVATGVDDKGRTQYIYPIKFTDRTSKAKFRRIKRFEKDAPQIISRVKSDIKHGDNSEAEVVYTMYKTGFRPGTDKETLADTKAFGASNLERRHVKVKPKSVEFHFIGKKGVDIRKEVEDPLLRKIIKRRITNKKLFEVSDSSLRDYFKSRTGGKYKLKDLRTLRAAKVATVTKGDNKRVALVVSEDLGNTPAVALSAYIPPEVLR